MGLRLASSIATSDASDVVTEQLRAVALGGGHGLAASLKALRRITSDITAVVTVADDGGSSGRLRRELGVLPPGDLRMALAALCGDEDWGRTWAKVVQHRFAGDGPLRGHSVGNLLIAALWEETGDVVSGLDWLGALLKVEGRVLPCSTVPLDVLADVLDASGRRTRVRGQVAVATVTGRVESLMLDPADPPACPEALTAIEHADVIVLGPGSWYTSVLTHVAIPGIRRAIRDSSARKILVVNLSAQQGETEGFDAHMHVDVLHAMAPDLRFDLVIADDSEFEPPGDDRLLESATRVGAHLVRAPLAGSSSVHDPDRLGRAFAQSLLGEGGAASRETHGSIPPWQ
jgi:uncharacterized cofD-like protein